MVNNSTNINKTNNHLLLQLNEHKKDHDVGIPGPGVVQSQHMVRLSQLMGSSPLNNLISNSHTENGI